MRKKNLEMKLLPTILVAFLLVNVSMTATSFEQKDEYLQECHPKEMYIRGPLKRVWDKNIKLPKL